MAVKIRSRYINAFERLQRLVCVVLNALWDGLGLLLYTVNPGQSTLALLTQDATLVSN